MASAISYNAALVSLDRAKRWREAEIIFIEMIKQVTLARR
jgi:hypothetical protein